MAIHLQTLKTRSITAGVFVIVMLAGLFLHRIAFIGLFGLIMIGCLYEFGKLMRKIHGSQFGFYLPIALLYIIMPILMLINLGIDEDLARKAGQAVINPGHFYSPLFPCAILFSIWINDTMAYIVGSFIGKTPFSKISPKKTWEGTIGGAVLCVLVIGLLGYFLPVAQGISLKHWVSLAAICAVFGTLGDLLESKIKRMADVKDSGTFMPGHGGFLDRFDSLLIATPFVWLYLWLFL